MPEPILDTATPIELDGHAGLAIVPGNARWLYVMAHGAGAGMQHAWMVGMAHAFAAVDIATVRFNLPAMAAGRPRPDSPAVATATIRTVVAAAHARYPALRVVAGGKSFGGRMTTTAQAVAPLPGVERIVLLGFPLHPAGAPGMARATHLAQVQVPMCFVQGGRDALATPALLTLVLADLEPRATLIPIVAADHGFAVPVRSGRTGAAVLAEIAAAVVAWLA